MSDPMGLEVCAKVFYTHTHAVLKKMDLPCSNQRTEKEEESIWLRGWFKRSCHFR